MLIKGTTTTDYTDYADYADYIDTALSPDVNRDKLRRRANILGYKDNKMWNVKRQTW